MKDKRLFIVLAALAGTLLLAFIIWGQLIKGDESKVAGQSPPSATAPGKGDKTGGMAAAPKVKASSPLDKMPEARREGIDPFRLAKAESARALNQLYEAEAKATLPTLSVQTHNPVWALEYEAKQGSSIAIGGGETAASAAQGPLPAPESGPFGNIQPPDGEIWIRLPAEQSRQYRDLMAQHADLYRKSTGYNGALSVMLWVGGRPYARQQYK